MRIIRTITRWITLFLMVYLLLFINCLDHPRIEQATDQVNLPTTSFIYLSAIGYFLAPDAVCDPSCTAQVATFSHAGAVKIGPDTLLTASHVCERFLNLSGRVGTIDSDGDLLADLKLLATDHTGQELPIDLVALNSVDDLCVIESKGIRGDFALIAEERPEVTERVWSVSTPTGLFTVGYPLIFDGIYSGEMVTKVGTMVSMFTFPGRPGSSGSPVFNSDGELVGIVHSVPKRFDLLAYAANQSTISRMIDLAY